MSLAMRSYEIELPESLLRDAFLRWQCRVRQIVMRENAGRPNDAISPEVFLPDHSVSLGHIVTVFSKAPEHSKIPELKHIYRYTNDPAQRLEKALQVFCETYYQNHREFSDQLTATFLPTSSGAKLLQQAGCCQLVFDAYGQRFDLNCTVIKLEPSQSMYQATWWHNILFNPNLPSDTTVLSFEPDWSNSSAEPKINGSTG